MAINGELILEGVEEHDFLLGSVGHRGDLEDPPLCDVWGWQSLDLRSLLKQQPDLLVLAYFESSLSLRV